jgi:hypothetical protein
MVGLSRSAACAHWAYARAWLHRRLEAVEGSAGGSEFFPFSAGWIPGRWRMEQGPNPTILLPAAK